MSQEEGERAREEEGNQDPAEEGYYEREPERARVSIF